jgi:ATP-dependent DNA helicase RecG
VDDKQIVAVTVQKGTDRPYYLASKGLKPSGVYVRNGTSTDPSTDTAIRRMIKETDGDSFESMRSLEQELTFRATEAQFQKCGVAFGSAQMKTLGLVSPDNIYSNVGLLLSDQCPSLVKAATFAGTERDEFQDRREFSGSLFQQMEELYAYLDLRNKLGATFQGLYRVDTRDYPETAVREALLNAIVHRDYAYSASTLVSVYSDRMEFVSIGGLPDGVGLEDIMLGLSVCRNPKLAAVFYRLKLIEAYGTGMPKIIKAYKGAVCQPKIEVTSNAF